VLEVEEWRKKGRLSDLSATQQVYNKDDHGHNQYDVQQGAEVEDKKAKKPANDEDNDKES